MKLVLIKTFGNRFEAEQFKSYLEGSGLTPVVKAEDESGLIPFLGFQLGVKVLVPEEQFATAMKLLNMTEMTED